MNKIATGDMCETARSETRLEEALNRLSYMHDEVSSLDVELYRIRDGLIGSVPECDETEPTGLDEQGKLGDLHGKISLIERRIRSMRETINHIQSLV